MTKKHFVSLADWIKRHNAECGREFGPDEAKPAPFTLDHLRTLAAFCESNNTQFNRGRWLDYIHGKCGPNGGKRD